MSETVPQRAAACHGNVGDSAVSEPVRRARNLRAAIDAADWKHWLLAEFVGVSKSYLSKMLSAEAAIPARVIAALPVDVRAELARIEAESYGFIVARPMPLDLAEVQAQRALLTLSHAAGVRS